jgi:hypothetical protein
MKALSELDVIEVIIAEFTFEYGKYLINDADDEVYFKGLL